jgi:hypothetical protein
LTRDPFGYEGSEFERPYWQAQLIGARLMLDHQEQAIARYCAVDPETGGYRFPGYPPSDHTRSQPALFAEWCRRMQLLDTWNRDLKKNGENLRSFHLGWRDDRGKVLTTDHEMGTQDEWCFRFEDMSLGYALAVSWEGRPCVGSPG